MTMTGSTKAAASSTMVAMVTTPVGGGAGAPSRGLGIEVIEICEAAGGEEGVAHILDGAFNAALLVSARDRHWTGLIAIAPGEGQQRRMEADGVAAALQHHAFEIVVKKNTGNAAPCGKGADMAAQEVLHPCVGEKAQENLARVAEHHDERHQRAARPANIEMAKMSPVHLRLFAGKAAQTQISLGFRTRAMARDEVTEVIGAAAIAALVRHHEQTTGGQRRKFLQRLADERQIRVDLRRPRRRTKPRQAGLRKHTPHHAVMHLQLTGDGAHCPFLSVVVAQDLRLDVRRRHHVLVLSDLVAAALDDGRGGAGTPGGGDQDTGDRTSGSARSVPEARHPRKLRRSRSPASRTAANHRLVAGVNPDASLFCYGSDSAAPEWRERTARDGWTGNVARQRFGYGAGLAARTLRRSKPDRGRNNCKSGLGRDTPRTETAWRAELRLVRTRRRPVDERHDSQDNDPACVPSTVWGTASMWTAKLTSAPCLPFDERQVLPAIRC